MFQMEIYWSALAPDRQRQTAKEMRRAFLELEGIKAAMMDDWRVLA